MPNVAFNFTSAGYSNIIDEFNSLGQAQRQLEQLVNNLAKSFIAQGQSAKQALDSAKQLVAANNLNAEAIQKLTDRQKELQKGSEALAALVKKRILEEKELAKAYNEQEKAVQQLGFSLKGNIDSFLKLGTAFNNNFTEANRAFEAYNQLRGSGASLQQTQQTLASQLGVTKDQFSVLNEAVIKSKANFEQAQQIIVGFGLAVSASVGKAFSEGAKSFAEFDRTIRLIGVVSESSGTRKLKDLSDQIKVLGRDTTKTPQDIAKMTVELVKAGLSADQAKVAIAGIVQTSEATGESLSKVGDIVVKTISQFNLTASDATRVGDVLTKVANTTNSDISTLGESLKYIGTAGAQSNQSVEDITAALGLLGNAGLEGSQGGRNLAQALTRLNVASSELSPELEGIVRGSQRMRDAFNLLQTGVRDSNNQLKPLPQVIDAIKKSLDGFSAGEKATLLKVIFGDEGGRAVLALIGQTDDKLKEVFQSANNAGGSAAKASKELNQGLSNSFTLLNSSLELLKQSLGESFAPALEGVVRGATALVNGFLALPAPVQAAVFGITGLAGALAAAIAALTAYNLAVNAGVIASAQLGFATVASGTAIAARTVTVTAATIAEVAMAVASGNFVAAQAALVPALTASKVALTGFVAAASAAAPVLLAVAGAIAVVKAYQFSEDLKETNEGLDSLAQQSVASSNEFGKLGGALRGLNNQFSENGKFTDEQITKGRGLLKITEDKIKALEGEIETTKNLKPVTDEQRAAQQADIAGKQRQIDALKNVSKELDTNIKATLSKAGAESRANDETIKGSEANSRKKQAVKDLTEELKKQAETEKEIAKQKFDDSEKNIKRTQDDQKETRRETFDDQIAKKQEETQTRIQGIREQQEEKIKTIQENNATELETRKKDFEQNVIEPLKLESEKKIQNLQSTFQKGQQEEKSKFEQSIREETAKFNRQQNSEKRSFELALNKEKKEFDKQASKDQKAIDRQLELTDPANAGKAGELALKYAQEDALAARREQLEAPLKAKREAFEEEQNKKKEEFELEQQKKKEGFEKQQNDKKLSFEQQLNNKKLEFENTVIKPLKIQQENEIANTKKQFEETIIKPIRIQQENELKAIRKQNESELSALRKQTENEIKQLRRQFNDEERAIERKQEDERTARERAFKAEERTRDEASAEKIKALKEQSGGKELQAAQLQNQAADKMLSAANRIGSLPGRKEGGSVAAGQAYIVGETQAEVFVPGVSGTVLNHDQIARNLNTFLKVPGISYDSVVAHRGSGRIEAGHGGDSRLLSELQGLRSTIESRNPSINIQTVLENDGKMNENEYQQFLRLQRSVIRASF